MVMTQLLQLRISSKKSRKEVADALGLTVTTISNWERGEKFPSETNLQKLAEYYQVTPAQLKAIDSNEAHLIKTYQDLNVVRKKKMIDYADGLMEEQNEKIIALHEVETTTVRVYEGLSAGIGFGVTGDGTYDEVTTSEKLPSYDIASWVRGDSMQPKFEDWSVVLIRETGFDYEGAIYAVYVEESNTTYIKKVFREKSGLRLVSLNKKYPDRFISYEDHPQIIGKIVGNFIPS